MKTTDLIKAALELAEEHDAQYAEDCVKAFLSQKKITVSQYCSVMTALYK